MLLPQPVRTALTLACAPLPRLRATLAKEQALNRDGFATTLIVNRKQHVFAAGALASLRMRRVVYVRLRSLFQGRPVRNVVE